MLITGTFGLLLTLAMAASAQTGQQYRVVDLGDLGGYLSVGKDINNNGQVAGTTELDDYSFRAFRFGPGGLIDLGVVPGETQSFGLAIDDAGRVFGASYRLGDITPRAFRVTPSSAIEDLGAFTPSGVNELGDVVGMVRVAASDGWISQRPCLYRDGLLTQLSVLGGGSGHAFDINDSRVIVGSCSLSDLGVTHASLWTDQSPVDLGTLGGMRSEAKAVNSEGVAAGYAETASGDPHACLFSLAAGGTGVDRIDLGTLPGAVSSYANDINDNGAVVGVSDSRAFIFESGQITDLNSMITPESHWTLRSAEAINNAGRIVGSGLFGGVPHAFMLIPINCPGDTDGSGVVDVDDLNAILSAWNTTVGIGSSADQANNDGFVDVDDLNVVLAHWLESC